VITCDHGHLQKVRDTSLVGLPVLREAPDRLEKLFRLHRGPRLPVDVCPGLFGPHLVWCARLNGQDLALFQRSLLTIHHDVDPAREDLEAFFLAGVVVGGWPGGARLRVDGLDLQELAARVVGRLAEDYPLAADGVLHYLACPGHDSPPPFHLTAYVWGGTAWSRPAFPLVSLCYGSGCQAG
jgi:hypothetical protein